mgnify:CR=1 FL=1
MIQYKILDPPLGKGGFGEVRKAIHRVTGLTKAIKLIQNKKLGISERAKLINEVEILKGIVIISE